MLYFCPKTYRKQLKELMIGVKERQKLVTGFLSKNIRKKKGNLPVNLFGAQQTGKARMARQWAIDRNKTCVTVIIDKIDAKLLEKAINQAVNIQVLVVDTVSVGKEVLDKVQIPEDRILIFCTKYQMEIEAIPTLEITCGDDEYCFVS